MVHDDDELIEDDELPTTFSVLQRKLQSWSFPEVSQALQFDAELALADATRIAKKRPGIMLSGVAEETAKATVRALRGLGVDCFLVPDAEIFEPPSPVHVDAMELLAEGFRATVAGGQGFELAVAGEDVTMIALARISGATPGGDVYTAAKQAKTGSLTQRPGVLAFGQQARKGPHEALAIYVGFLGGVEGTLIHVDSLAFDFGCLGKQRTSDRLENLCRVLNQIHDRAPGAVLTPGTIAARDGGRTLDQHPHVNDFHDECLWRLDLMELKRKKEARG